jgi:branched-chain amino acid aminotransferase
VQETAQQHSSGAPDPHETPHRIGWSDHMFSMVWSPDAGWHDAELTELHDLSLHPATAALHYGQSVFDGFKAYRQVDGSLAVFRPWDHARRFARSARRMAMPPVPEPLLVDAVEQLVAADGRLLDGAEDQNLYLRPLLFATDSALELRSSVGFRFVLMASVTQGYFGQGTDGIRVYVSREHARAMPGGTGDVKVAGNYAPTFAAQRLAREAGCEQVVWLDVQERRWLEELSGMNLFLVRGADAPAEVVTPALTGTLLPGLTRDTLLTLAARSGYAVREQQISVEQWRQECHDGRITEAFACGTAATVIPVLGVQDGDHQWAVGNGLAGPVTTRMRQALADAHRGVLPDRDGWLHPVGQGG